MEAFSYQHGVLHCEDVRVAELAAKWGTPLFVYSRRAILERLREIQEAFAAAQPLVCYSLKTNSHLAICRLMAEGGAGFDVTSGGELDRALRAGGRGDKIVFAGVGKTDAELRAGLEAGVLLFNVESEAEFQALADVARSSGKQAN